VDGHFNNANEGRVDWWQEGEGLTTALDTADNFCISFQNNIMAQVALDTVINTEKHIPSILLT